MIPNPHPSPDQNQVSNQEDFGRFVWGIWPSRNSKPSLSECGSPKFRLTVLQPAPVTNPHQVIPNFPPNHPERPETRRPPSLKRRPCKSGLKSTHRRFSQRRRCMDVFKWVSCGALVALVETDQSQEPPEIPPSAPKNKTLGISGHPTAKSGFKSCR
jgi:hypothetical protein